MYDKCYFCLDQLPKLKKESTASFFVTFWRSRGTKEPAYITVILSLYWRWLAPFFQQSWNISIHDFRDRPPCGNKWKSKGWSHEDKQFSLLAFPKLRKKVIHYDCGLPFSKGGISLLPFLLFGGVMNSWVGKAGLSTQIKETKRSVKKQYQKNRKKETAKLWQGSKRH